MAGTHRLKLKARLFCGAAAATAAGRGGALARLAAMLRENPAPAATGV